MGNGNSPPDRKLASLPLMARRFGSARDSSRFLASSALMDAARLISLRNNKTLSMSERLMMPLVPMVGPVNCPVLPAVEKTVQAQSQGATIKGFTQETEDGALEYE